MALTKQEYYDLLVRSASDGTFPSLDGDGSCLYRGPEGARCAVGLLIPDDRYTEELEGKVPGHNAVYQALEGSVPAGLTERDLTAVQLCHDDVAAGSFDANDRRLPWSADAFVASINALPCFADVARAPAGGA